jgi:cytidine deaminase
VAFITSSGQVPAGGYIESAAHNPGLPPLQAAVVAGIVGGCLPSYDQVGIKFMFV